MDASPTGVVKSWIRAQARHAIKELFGGDGTHDSSVTHPHPPPPPMASNYTCSACSRALFRSSRRAPALHRAQAARNFSTTAPSLYHATLPKFAASQPISQPAAAKKADPSRLRADPDSSSMRGFAAKLRQKAPLMTETYVAYAATQSLLKECARHGEYKIPQALEKDGEIPLDETGAHLGVSDGWWFKGETMK